MKKLKIFVLCSLLLLAFRPLLAGPPASDLLLQDKCEQNLIGDLKGRYLRSLRLGKGRRVAYQISRPSSHPVDPNKVLFVVNGWASEIKGMKEFARAVGDYGHTVVTIALSAHSESFGTLPRAEVPYFMTPAGSVGGTLSYPTFLSLDELSEEVEAVRQHLKIERVVLAGYSLGAFVATRLALQNPQAYKKLLLVVPGVRSSHLDNPMGVALRADYNAQMVTAQLLRLNPFNPLGAYSAQMIENSAELKYNGLLAQAMRPMLTTIVRNLPSFRPEKLDEMVTGLVALGLAVRDVDLRQEINQIQVPVALVQAQNEDIARKFAQEELFNQVPLEHRGPHLVIPGAKHAFIPEVGHELGRDFHFLIEGQ